MWILTFMGVGINLQSSQPIGKLGPSRRGGGAFKFDRFNHLCIQTDQIQHSRCLPDCMVPLWQGPQLLLANVKDVDGQDWFIYHTFSMFYDHAEAWIVTLSTCMECVLKTWLKIET